MNVLGIIRHGPTLWNREKRIQGNTNIPLVQNGFDICGWRQILDQYGPWDRIVSSPLERCRKTCELLFPEREITLDVNLREQDWGAWTGNRLNEIEKTSPGAIAQEELRGWDFTPPGGESRLAVLSRVEQAIRQATGEMTDARILFVSHLGVIKILLNHLEQTSFLPRQSTLVVKRGLHLIKQRKNALTILKKNIELP